MSNTKLTIGLVVVAIIAIIGIFTPLGKTVLGGVTNYDELDATALRIGGANSSRLDLVAVGTCNPSQSRAGSHAASTSMEYLCAVSGVSAGDNVDISLPVGAGINLNGAGSLFGGFQVVAAYATTTGYIGIQIANNTGVATSSFPQATTSVSYFVTSTRSTVPGL